MRGRTVSALAALLSPRTGLWGTIRGAGIVMAIRICGAGLAFLSQVVLARIMGAYEIGLYSYAVVLVTVLSILVPLGMDWAVLRLIPEYLAKKRWRRMSGVLRASVSVVGAVAVAIALVGAAVIHIFSDHIGEHYLVPLYLALASLPVYALFQIYMSFAKAFGWMGLAYTPQYILRPSLHLLLVIGLVLVGAPATANVVLVVSLVATAVALAYQAGTVHRRKKRVTRPATPAYHLRAWRVIALSMAMFNGYQLFIMYGDVLLLGNFVAPDQIGIYNAALKSASVLNFVLLSVGATATPKYAELYATHRHEELREYVAKTACWIFWPSLLGGILMIVGGKYILLAFGPAFVEGYPVLVILIMSNLSMAAAGNVDALLMMTGQQRACIRVMRWTGVAFVALNMALIPLIGIAGAAIAVLATTTVKFAWLVIIAKQRLGIVALVTLGWPRSGPVPPRDAAIGLSTRPKKS